MEDIAPQLLETLHKCFAEKISTSARAQSLLETIQSGKGTYDDAERFAYLAGSALAEVFQEKLSSEVLPDGRMYYNIAERVLRPLLNEDHELVSNAAEQVQYFLNRKAGIGLKVQKPSANKGQIDSIINSVSSYESFDDGAWMLKEPVIHFSQTVVDELLKANLDFQASAGIHPKIVRKAERKCCETCASLAGEFSYPDDIPDDVFWRHNSCRCVVLYDPDGTKKSMQNVHTKKWTDPQESAMIEKRKIIGLRTNNVTVADISQHAYERIEERNVTIESVKDAIEHPLKIYETKYDADGRPSFKIIGRKATISINPETGIITTVYPTHTKTANKLTGRK